ncbi:MAG: transketolase [Candidatus Omnitrophica bacterium]|nr:transketolase [Candidatus Omnitrophota bacterium]MDD5080429.1 transketolase [Candidatus Omnitrophota bacterium]MDD5441031.1 transketolase [Candidatus Omnitrophota bacterium]
MDSKIDFIKEKSIQIRTLIIKMLAKCGSGHPGGSLSSADIIACLYFEVLNHSAKDQTNTDRDKFHLSKGHGCPALYAALSLCGYFKEEELWKLRTINGLLQGHPTSRIPGINVSSGSLGHGLSIALGMALSGKIDKKDYRVYCLMGDGEMQEGNIWEAAMAAAHYHTDNLCGIVDCNGLQIDGKTDEVMRVEPLADKWLAFGWHVIKCDGHSVAELLDAFSSARNIKDKPVVILARTVKGKGVSFMEGVLKYHGVAPTPEEEATALKELEK